MAISHIPGSFAPGESATDRAGQRAHPESIAQTACLERKLHRPGSAPAWSLVGNGLSNQNFVEGPDGLIVIDAGECVEEMRAALRAVRAETDASFAACIFTHFHYVNGTRALLEAAEGELPIFGHVGIEANLRRFGGEAAPRYTRGLIHQFGATRFSTPGTRPCAAPTRVLRSTS